MENFLRESKANSSQVESFDSICIILGNESCDLDSAVCALVYAYFLEKQKKFASVHLPVLNIPKEDYILKTEVDYFLKRFNISSDILIFRNEICFNSLQKEKKLKLILVDHNILPSSDSYLDSSIIQIVDHHKQEHKFSENIDMLIEAVGSCSTLISSLIFDSAPEILFNDTISSSLLLGAIVVDVANFSSTAKRATTKDEQIFSKLLKLVPNISKDILYGELQCAKKDVVNLKFEQLCQKDRKIIEIEGINLPISGIPFLCSTLLSKHLDIASKLQDYCSTFDYQGTVLLGISIDEETDIVKRDLVVYSPLAWLKNRLCRELENADEPNLDLRVIKSNAEYVFYNQGNTIATRKVILPMLKNILSKPESTNSTLSQHGERLSLSISNDGSPDNSSASNSGIDTPTNSCNDDDEEVRCSSVAAKLSEFRTDVFANEGSKQYFSFRQQGDELRRGERDPLTPENSFAESHFDQSYQKFVLNHMDSDAIEKKLRKENFFREADE